VLFETGSSALKDAGKGFVTWLNLTSVEADFPVTWLPADSEALKPLGFTLEAVARVVNNVSALPWSATVNKTAMTPEGKNAPCPYLATPAMNLYANMQHVGGGGVCR